MCVCVCVWGGGGQSGGVSKRYISLVHNTSWSTQCAMLTHARGTFFFSYYLSFAHIITTKFVQEYHQSFKHVKILSGPTLNVEPDWIPTICKKVISRRHFHKFLPSAYFSTFSLPTIRASNRSDP